MNLLDLQRCEKFDFQSGMPMWACVCARARGRKHKWFDGTCFLSQQLTKARTPLSSGCSSSMGTSSDVRNRSQVSMATDTYYRQMRENDTNQKTVQFVKGMNKGVTCFTIAFRCTETRASHNRAQLRAASATSEKAWRRHIAASMVTQACTTLAAQSFTVSLLWMT